MSDNQEDGKENGEIFIDEKNEENIDNTELEDLSDDEMPDKDKTKDSDEIKERVYTEIDDNLTVLDTLVENILHDETYQEYLTELEISDDKNRMKKALNIRKTFADIKVFNSKLEPLFLAKDIGTIIGAANVKQMIKNYNSDEKVVGAIRHGSGVRRVEFLTRHGIYRILFNNRSKLSEVFRGFIYKLLDHMFQNEMDKMNKLMNDYANENRQLIAAASKELVENFTIYKDLYKKEYEERKALEDELFLTEKSVTVLQEQKLKLYEKFSYKVEQKMEEEVFQVNAVLKDKFMKKFIIWLVNPENLDKLFIPGKTTKAPYELKDERFFIKDYKDNFHFYAKAISNGIMIDDKQILYLTLTYVSDKDSAEHIFETAKEKYNSMELSALNLKDAKIEGDYPATYDYVYDTRGLAALVEKLKEDSTKYYVISKNKKSANNFIFRTSIENIKTHAMDLITGYSC